jgi:ABC-2 type transport system permease protein
LVLIIFVEFLSGALFPMDVLPHVIQSFVMSLPFPYLIYFPIQVYLGKITGIPLVYGILTSLFWVIALGFLMKYIWARGLKAYESIGR